MSIVPITWNEFYRTAQTCRYQHPRALRDQVEALKPACTDLTPYVYRDPSIGALLLAKGKMLNPTPAGEPAVHFAITLKPQFPNAYPILSIEQPPAGWRIANHPHVDREGLCYLDSVTNWNPRHSTIFGACAELQQVLTNRHPYERAPNAPPPQPPRPAQQTRQQQPQSSPYPTQQSHQQQGQQQQRQQERSGAQVVAGGAGLALSVMGALLTAGANAGSNRTTGATASDGQRVPVLAPEAEQRAREQRERDRAWLQQQQQQRSTGQHLMQQQENDATLAFAKERFVAILHGTTRIAPDTELATPPDFGLAGRVKTHPQGISGPLVLTRKAAPRPLAAVTEPTPDEQYHLQQAEAQRAHQEAEQRQAREPAPQGALGFGLRALTRGVGALSKAATSAKHSVEDRVRNNSMSSEAQRFQTLFPTVPHAQEPMVTNYHCKLVCGDGVARAGYLFLTHRNVYFSSKTIPGESSSTPPPAGAGGVVVQTVVPLAAIVSLALGSAVNSKCLHVLCQDNSCRTFVDFHSNKMVELGAYVSSAVKGTALDRCYNWLDHLWRAAVPAVPVPGYPYEQPLAGGSAAPVPPAAGTSQITGASAGLDIPTPGPMYAHMSPSAPAPPPQQQPATPSQISASTSNSEAADGDKADAMLCAICLDRPKNCFLRPCGHVASCMDCSQHLQACPICRAPISDRFQAFI